MNTVNTYNIAVPSIARNARIYSNVGGITFAGGAGGTTPVITTNYLALTGTTQNVCSNVVFVGNVCATSICSGNITLLSGASRTITLPNTCGQQYNISIIGQPRNFVYAGNSCAGDVCVIAGTATVGTAMCGGDTYIIGGYACGAAGTAATGGDVVICGGNANLVSGAGGTTGGNIFIKGGVGTNAGGTCNCGCVALHFGATKVLETNTAGVCVTGVVIENGTCLASKYVNIVATPTAKDVAMWCSATCAAGSTWVLDTTYGIYPKTNGTACTNLGGTSNRLICGFFTGLNAGTALLSGCLCTDTQVSNSIAYTSGWLGNGYKLWKDASNNYNLEIDNLSVRENLCAQTFIINQTKASNGDLVITDSMCGLSGFTLGSNGKYYFQSCSDMTFAPNDIIRAQSMQCTNVYSYTYTVYSADTRNNRVYINENASGICASQMPFVRLGNTTNTARQSMMYLTPYCGSSLKVYNGVNSTTITPAMEVVRLGSLDGISGANGYGLYSTNAYLTGTINSTCGCIAGYCISNQSLNNAYITLNNNCISIADATGTEKISLKNCGLSSIAQIVGASCVSIPLACAAGTMHTIAVATTSNFLDYYQQTTAANNACLSYYATCQASKNLTITGAKNYVVQASIKVNTDYSLCANIDCKTACCYCINYNRCGTYVVNGTTVLYDCLNNPLITNCWSSSNYTPNQGYSDNNVICVIPAQSVCITNPAVYMTTCYSIANSAYQQQVCTLYCYSGGKYFVCGNSYGSCALTVNTRIQENCLALVGSVGVTEIGSCGLQSVFNTTNYFRYDPTSCTSTAYGCLASCGTCTTLCTTGTLICGTNTQLTNCCTCVNSSCCIAMTSCNIYLTPITNTGSVIVCANQNSGNGLMCIQNTTLSNNTPALSLQAGCATQTTLCHIFVKFYNNTPSVVGCIINNAGTMQFVSTSDCRYKCCIQSTSISALDTLNSLQVSNYVWTGDTTNTNQIGFIAQQAQPLNICKFVNYDEEADKYGITDTALIPYLVKGLQELTCCIIDLKTCLNNISK